MRSFLQYDAMCDDQLVEMARDEEPSKPLCEALAHRIETLLDTAWKLDLANKEIKRLKEVLSATEDET